jgi:hypothetical protein
MFGMENLMGMFGGGGVLMDMLIPMVTKPETMKMLQDKTKEMFAHLAEKFECGIHDVSISLQLKKVTVNKKDEEGNIVIELDENGQPKNYEQERFVILFFVDKEGKRTAVQKAWADEYLQDLINQIKDKK